MNGRWMSCGLVFAAGAGRLAAGCFAWWRGTGAFCCTGPFSVAAGTEVAKIRATASPRECLMSISTSWSTTGAVVDYWIMENVCQPLSKTAVIMKVRIISVAFGLLLAALATPVKADQTHVAVAAKSRRVRSPNCSGKRPVTKQS